MILSVAEDKYECYSGLVGIRYIKGPSCYGMNIFALGAHQDDVELGSGRLLIKAARRGHDW